MVVSKYPERGYTTNPQLLKLDGYEEISDPMDFGNQYAYFHEGLDPRFPEPLLKELSITIFCDSDRAHYRVTGRSITIIVVCDGLTPMIWSSKPQLCVQNYSDGAGFTALKRQLRKL